MPENTLPHLIRIFAPAVEDLNLLQLHNLCLYYYHQRVLQEYRTTLESIDQVQR